MIAAFPTLAAERDYCPHNFWRKETTLKLELQDLASYLGSVVDSYHLCYKPRRGCIARTEHTEQWVTFQQKIV